MAYTPPLQNKIFTSMRLPSFDDQGARIESAGGLFVVVEPITGNASWIGAAGTQADARSGLRGNPYEVGNGVVDLRYSVLSSADEAGARYLQNEIFWPLKHAMASAIPPVTPENEQRLSRGWQHYIEQNRAFADPVIKHAPYGADLNVHDYQQMLVPGFVRAARPDIRIVYTHHVPWFGPEEFQLLPQPIRRSILHSLQAADAVTVHDDDWGLDLLQTYRDERMVAPLIVPSIAQPDINKLRLEGRDPRAQELARHLLAKYPGRTMLTTIGRGDEPKNGMVTAAVAAREIVERGLSTFNIRSPRDLERLTTDQMRMLPVFVVCAQPTRMGKTVEPTIFDKFGGAFFDEIRGMQEAGMDVEIFTSPGRHFGITTRLVSDVFLVPSWTDGRNLTGDEAIIAGELNGRFPTGVMGTGAAASRMLGADGNGVLVTRRPDVRNFRNLLEAQRAYASDFAANARKLLHESPAAKRTRWETTIDVVVGQDPERWLDLLHNAGDLGARLTIDQEIYRNEAHQRLNKANGIEDPSLEEQRVALAASRPPMSTEPRKPLPWATERTGDPAAPVQYPAYSMHRHPQQSMARLRTPQLDPSIGRQEHADPMHLTEMDPVQQLLTDDAIAKLEGPSELFVENVVRTRHLGDDLDPLFEALDQGTLTPAQTVSNEHLDGVVAEAERIGFINQADFALLKDNGRDAELSDEIRTFAEEFEGRSAEWQTVTEAVQEGIDCGLMPVEEQAISFDFGM